MDAFLWHVDGRVRHHIRAASSSEVREKIAATHGEEVAERAVIKKLDEHRDGDPQNRAA